MADETAQVIPLSTPVTAATETEVEVPAGFRRVEAKVTRQYTEPQLVPASQPTPRIQASTVKKDKETINALLESADAVRYRMVVHRYWPTYEPKTGARYPTDSIMDVELMNLDELRRAITETWGGGNYRVVIVDKNTNDVQDKFGCYVIHIRQEDFPAKLSRGVASSVSTEEESERQQELREERRMASEKRRTEHEAATLRAQVEIEEIRQRMRRSAEGGGNGKDSMSTLLEVLRLDRDAQEKRLAQEHIEAERKETERRAEAERKENERRDQARRDREDVEKRAKEEKEALLKALTEMSSHIKEAGSGRSDAGTEMIKALAPMLAPRQDSSMAALELMKAGQDTMVRIADMNIKNATREDRAWSQERNQLLQLLVNNKDNSSSFREYLQVLGEMKAEVREDLKLATNFAGEGGENEYEPRLGFWGNTAKAVFNGLSELVKSAATNPQLLHLLFKLFGTGRPTQEQMVRAANRMAQGQQPVLLTPPQPGPQPMPQPVPGQPLLLTPSQPRLTPPGQPGQQPAQEAGPPPMTQAQQQVATATELEGETIGVGTGLDQPIEDNPQSRLREFVTTAIKDCCDDIQDKREAREWFRYAHDWWNGDFKAALVAAPSDEMRVALIQQQCSPEMWERLNSLIGGDVTGQETIKFFNALRELVNLNTPKPEPMPQTPPPPVPQTPPPTPIPVMQTPPPPQAPAPPQPVPAPSAATPLPPTQ